MEAVAKITHWIREAIRHACALILIAVILSTIFHFTGMGWIPWPWEFIHQHLWIDHYAQKEMSFMVIVEILIIVFLSFYLLTVGMNGWPDDTDDGGDELIDLINNHPRTTAIILSLSGFTMTGIGLLVLRFASFENEAITIIALFMIPIGAALGLNFLVSALIYSDENQKPCRELTDEEIDRIATRIASFKPEK